jgi:MFS family permease
MLNHATTFPRHGDLTTGTTLARPARRTRAAPTRADRETPAPLTPRPSTRMLLPIMAVVLIAFLVIGMALPVLPLHVHHDLGFGTATVGLVTGSQFVASLVSRVWAGRYADKRGAKRTVVTGLLIAAAAGLLYVASLGFAGITSVAILLSGRALLGAAESLVITGAITWGMAVAGAANAGRVIAWIGMSLFAALALGAPIGTALYSGGGFVAVAAATIAAPLLTLLLVTPLSAVPPQRGAQPGFLSVASAVWLPGVGSALSSIGMGAMMAFSSLIAIERGWSPVWLAFSAFALALVTARLFFGQLPDRLGGARVALASVVIEAAGLALIWLAGSPALAAIGAALTGFGYALVYPGLGVEAVRRAPAQSRGLAMGAYTVFLDVALGFGTPALGFIAGWTGLGWVFLASAILALGAALIAAVLLRTTRHA